MFALLLFNWIFCTPIADQNLTAALPYQINVPTQTLIMPDELAEISGVSLTSDGKYLVAVQDENGIVFYVNKTTGKIEKQIKFWEDGDYEDVEVVGTTIYVVKSSGTIYEVPEDGKNVKKYNFGLNSENDVEGLAYDAKNKRLLLACKNKVNDKSDSDSKRAIYAFDLNTQTLNEKPAYLIKAKEVAAHLKTLPTTSATLDMLDAFKSDDMAFAPSAVAIHPRTGHLHLLSAIGNILLVLDTNGQVVQVEKLKKKIHAQPEGIRFDQNETLYLSNEGKDGEPGKIYVFKANDKN